MEPEDTGRVPGRAQPHATLTSDSGLQTGRSGLCCDVTPSLWPVITAAPGHGHTATPEGSRYLGRGRDGFAPSFLPLRPCFPPLPHPSTKLTHQEAWVGPFTSCILKQVSGKTELGSQTEPPWGPRPPSPETLGLPGTPLPQALPTRAAGAQGGPTLAAQADDVLWTQSILAADFLKSVQEAEAQGRHPS